MCIRGGLGREGTPLPSQVPGLFPAQARPLHALRPYASLDVAHVLLPSILAAIAVGNVFLLLFRSGSIVLSIITMTLSKRPLVHTTAALATRPRMPNSEAANARQP